MDIVVLKNLLNRSFIDSAIANYVGLAKEDRAECGYLMNKTDDKNLELLVSPSGLLMT